MVNTKNSPWVSKHFQTMSFMPTRKAVYCNLPRPREVIRQVIGINITMSAWEQIPFSQMYNRRLIVKLFDFNTSTPSLLGTFRTVHYSYLPDDCNNAELVNSVAIISLSLSLYQFIYIYIYVYKY